MQRVVFVVSICLSVCFLSANVCLSEVFIVFEDGSSVGLNHFASSEEGQDVFPDLTHQPSTGLCVFIGLAMTFKSFFNLKGILTMI